MGTSLISSYSNRRELRAEFDRLALCYHRDFFRSALRFSGSAEDAEDLVQETLLKAYLAFDRFQPGTNFRAWVLRILTNTGINQYRRRTRLPGFISLDEFSEESTLLFSRGRGLSDSEPESVYFQTETRRNLMTAVDSLPEKFSSVVKLADAEELSLKEISCELNIPLGTVQSRLSRGRRMLRERLESVVA